MLERWGESLRRLNDAGLDLLRPFLIDDECSKLFPFERFGRERNLGLLVGNTRALWQPFTDWYGQQHPTPSHPIDTYVQRQLEACRQAVKPLTTRLYLSHQMDFPLADGTRGPVPMVRLAAQVGLTGVSPVHLAVHPTYGLWISLRAVFSFDADWTDGARHDVAAKDETTDAPERHAPCERCQAPCVDALSQAQQTLTRTGRIDAQNWRAWLGIREVCPVGGQWAYPEKQSEYHYTHNQRLLRPIAARTSRWALDTKNQGT